MRSGRQLVFVCSILSCQAFLQYRELGFLLWRGFTLRQVADQCFGNALECGKGRQMPIHYGSPELHVHTISSVLATQVPHAVGAAFALKVLGTFLPGSSPKDISRPKAGRMWPSRFLGRELPAKGISMPR